MIANRGQPLGKKRTSVAAQMAVLGRLHRLARRTAIELASTGRPAGIREVKAAVLARHGVLVCQADLTGELLGHYRRDAQNRQAS